MSPQEKQDFRTTLHNFVARESERTPSHAPSRVPSVLALRALNHGLRVSSSGSLSLSTFVPAVPMRKLSGEEVRFFRPVSEFPEHMRGRGLKRRACILNRATKKTRIEVPRDADNGHRLHIRSDRGSSAWSPLFGVYAELQVCGSFFWDEAHKSWDDCRNALRDGGVHNLFHSLVTVANCNSGPFGGASFYRQLVDCKKQWVQQASVSDPWFQCWYSFLHHEHMKSNHGFGSTEVMNEVLQRFSHSDLLHKKGEKVKLARWYSLLDRMSDMVPLWWSYACMVALLAIQKGLFKDMQALWAYVSADAPTTSEGSEVPGPSADAVASEHACASEGVEGRKRKGTDSKAILKVVVKTMTQPLHYYLVQAMIRICAPVRESHGEYLRKTNTRWGSAQHLAELAGGEWAECLNAVASVSLSSEFVSAIGLGVSHLDHLYSLLDVEEEQTLAEIVHTIMYRVIARRLLSYMSYSYSLPMKLFGLVDEREAMVQSTLTELSKWWEAWQFLEAESNKGKTEYDAVLEQLVWTSWDWPRRMLVILAEGEWQSVPPEVRDELLQTARLPAGTKQTEDGIREIRRACDVTPSKQLSHDSKWAALLRSDVLPNADIMPMRSTQESAAAASGLRVNAQLYAPTRQNAEEGLPEDFLAKLTSKRTPWRSPNSSFFDSMPLTLKLALCHHQTGVEIDKPFYNLLAVEGTIVQHSASGASGLCIHASSSGILLWKLRVEALGDLKSSVYRLTCSGKQNWSFHVVTDWSQWKSAGVTALTPRAASRLGGGSDTSTDLVLRLQRHEKPQDLLKVSALHGFRGCSVPQLKLLWQDWHEKTEREFVRPPSGEKEIVESLSQLVLHPLKVTSEDIWEKRHKQFSSKLPTVLTPAIAEELEEALDENDLHDLLAGIEADMNVAKQRAKASQKSKKEKVLATSASGSRKPLPLAARKSDYTVKEVRAFCPDHLSIQVSKEVTWHKRWRAHCPDLPAPNRYNGMFSGDMSEHTVVVNLIKWSWQMSERSGGSSCPWELPEV
eukprot:6491458-Amphidinium_carterae.5